jgi:pre-mRNA-splicing factor RBM22/SLT11
MAPKLDVNRAGWEETDMPSVCENCLGPDHTYMQMLKESHGAECKICSRPFTLFRWKTDRTSRQKKTIICLTCSRTKNCCQHCMLDLQFGLPIVIRDAALNMVSGPNSEINKQYHAQQNEKLLEEQGVSEEFNKTNDKAHDLLRRLAASEPYYKKQRRLDFEGEGEQESGVPGAQKALPPAGTGPTRPRDSKLAGAVAARGSSRGGRGGGRGGFRGSVPIRPQDIAPPSDRNIVSLFVTGVEDDLPEHEIRTFFAKFGTLRSLICSHRAHSAFVNYATRQGAEAAAEACQGRAVVKGVPLRVQWGKPKALDTLDREQRIENAKAGRAVAEGSGHVMQGGMGKKAIEAAPVEEDFDALVPMNAPGEEDVEYAALAGN